MMEMVKSDWTLVREAEQKGLVVAMTGMVERNRTELNDELSDYFRKSIPNYHGSFNEEEGEEVLYALNEYIDENKIEKPELDFPYTSGSEIHLIPIGKYIKLKVLIVDEYHGGGEYAKYIMIDYFLMEESTSKEDVDKLIEFVKEYLMF